MEDHATKSAVEIQTMVLQSWSALPDYSSSSKKAKA